MLGISLGGRVALEAALHAPGCIRARVIAIAPYLPWLRFRALLAAGVAARSAPGRLDAARAGWPVLRWLARVLEKAPYLREDELAQAGARLVYYCRCPATRREHFSAARELALDPAHRATRDSGRAAGASRCRPRSCGASGIS